MFGLQAGDHALVIATHPDDETLGLGATIAKMVEHGIVVDVLIITCVTAPMCGGTSDTTIRIGEFHAACDVLGVADRGVAWVDTPEAVDPGTYLGQLVGRIEFGPGLSVRSCQPKAVFVPTADAHHQDHRAVHHAAMAAVRPGDPDCRAIPYTVIGYEGPEDRAWLAACTPGQVLVDTSVWWPTKVKALGCYGSQMRAEPHPRSIGKIRAFDEATGAAIAATTAERFVVYRMGF